MPKVAFDPVCLTSKHEGRNGHVRVRATILWYSLGPAVTPTSKVISREYLSILGQHHLPDDDDIIITIYPVTQLTFKKILHESE